MNTSFDTIYNAYLSIIDNPHGLKLFKELILAYDKVGFRQEAETIKFITEDLFGTIIDYESNRSNTVKQ